jgi:transposase
MTKLNKISINSAIQEAEEIIEKDKTLSPAIKATIKMLIMLVSLLAARLNINSKNSSTPPADDKNRKRGRGTKSSDKKPGGQNGRAGVKLKKVGNPDRIEIITIDKRKLPKGAYKEVGFESRQVFDIEINSVITEYRAQILEDQDGKRYVAEFPAFVKTDVQYGTEVKVNSVYMSQFQLLPYNRIQDQFADQMQLPLSVGTIFNFNQEAYRLLETFEEVAKNQLSRSGLLHNDETSININKKKHWLHTASNQKWTYFYPHEKRGCEAIDDIGILPKFSGISCHDHWKPYFKYSCTHALCNAHHLRELTYAEEEEKQLWAKTMRELLLEINTAVDQAGGEIEKDVADIFRKRYREIIEKADKTECPEPQPEKSAAKKRGRIKKTKSRNLLERLRDFEAETLRFMEIEYVPFTNNLSENDIRMTKVQQKISGCFRSVDGAYMFCRIRSYLSTCRKNDINATEALRLLFQGKMPDFINEVINI